MHEWFSTLSENQFNFGKCNKQYSGYDGLYRHNKTVHKGAQCFCHKCDCKATQKSSLNRHVNAIRKRKQYPC